MRGEEAQGLGTITCIPSPFRGRARVGENPLTQAERGNLGFWGTGSGVPFLSVRFFGYAKKGPRRTGVGAPAKAKRPVDAWPGERARHG